MHGTYLLPASAGNWIDPDLSRLPRLSFGRCRRLLLRACSRVGCTLYNVLLQVSVAFRHNSNIVVGRNNTCNNALYRVQVVQYSRHLSLYCTSVAIRITYGSVSTLSPLLRGAELIPDRADSDISRLRFSRFRHLHLCVRPPHSAVW